MYKMPHTIEQLQVYPIKQIWTIMVVMLIGLMTIPHLVIGYGMDADAVRSVKAAEELLTTGSYIPSRLPGNPLFEYLLTIITPWGGHIASNLFVFALYVVGIGAFSFLVRRRDDRWIIVSLFALTPLLLVNAVTTMDYIPGLALMLLCYAFATKKRYVLAPIFLGLSIGFRLSNAVFLVPLIIYLVGERQGLYAIIRFSVISMLLGLAFYIPILMEVGPEMFLIRNSYTLQSYLLSVSYRGLMLIGPVATIGLLLFVLANRQKIILSCKENLLSKSPSFVLEVTTILAFTLLFLLHPDETAYLIPVIAFAYLVVSRWLPKKQLIVLGVLIIAFAFFTVELKGGDSGARTITFKPAWGVVVRDYLGRTAIAQLREGIGQFDLSDRAVVLTGMGPALTYENDSLVRSNYNDISPRLLEEGITDISNIHRLSERDVYLLYGISRENVALLQEDGYTVYMFSEYAPSVAINGYGYYPHRIGVIMLNVLNRKAFYKD